MEESLEERLVRLERRTYAPQNEKRTLTITQQSAPFNTPPLDQLEGLKKLDVVTGNAAIGAERGRIVAIITTPIALISIMISSNVPEAGMAEVATNLRPIN